jgi:hypothetical protein
MKLGIVGLAGLVMMSAMVLGTTQLQGATQMSVTQVDRPASAEPQQNDRRPAIAKVNPQKPIQIRVISRTKEPVVASVIPVVGDRPVAPGKSVTFGRLHTSYLPLPMDLQVSLQNDVDPNKPISVYLDVKTVGNEIVVGVRTAASGTGNTSQTVNVNSQGLVYVF